MFCKPSFGFREGASSAHGDKNVRAAGATVQLLDKKAPAVTLGWWHGAHTIARSADTALAAPWATSSLTDFSCCVRSKVVRVPVIAVSRAG